MAYKFLDVIKDIEEGLRTNANQAHEEKQRINTRQAEINAELAALEPRLLRAKHLKSSDDLICAHCFINKNIESPLNALDGEPHIDYFRCSKCGEEYELPEP